MGNSIARIEVYPNYNSDGSVNYDLPFSYGCLELDLMGYEDILPLIFDIREKLRNAL